MNLDVRQAIAEVARKFPSALTRPDPSSRIPRGTVVECLEAGKPPVTGRVVRHGRDRSGIYTEVRETESGMGILLRFHREAVRRKA